MWPIEGLPFLLKCFGFLLPFALPVAAFRELLVKDSPITDTTVILAFVVMFMWIVVQLFLCYWFIKDKDYNAKKTKK